MFITGADQSLTTRWTVRFRQEAPRCCAHSLEMAWGEVADAHHVFRSPSSGSTRSRIPSHEVMGGVILLVVIFLARLAGMGPSALTFFTGGSCSFLIRNQKQSRCPSGFTTRLTSGRAAGGVRWYRSPSRFPRSVFRPVRTGEGGDVQDGCRLPALDLPDGRSVVKLIGEVAVENIAVGSQEGGWSIGPVQPGSSQQLTCPFVASGRNRCDLRIVRIDQENSRSAYISAGGGPEGGRLVFLQEMRGDLDDGILRRRETLPGRRTDQVMCTRSPGNFFSGRGSGCWPGMLVPMTHDFHGRIVLDQNWMDQEDQCIALCKIM